MIQQVDDIDKVILESLQDDARIAYRKIAERIGVSEATIYVRVKKLIERGIIKRFSALLSPELVGKRLTAFILLNTDPKKLPEVLKTISKMDDIYEAYDVTGTYYAIVKIRTENRNKLAEIIDKIGLIEGVTSTETAIVLRSIKEENRIKIGIE